MVDLFDIVSLRFDNTSVAYGLGRSIWGNLNVHNGLSRIYIGAKK